MSRIVNKYLYGLLNKKIIYFYVINQEKEIMKKLILLTFQFYSIVALMAQSNPVVMDTVKYSYCEIIGTGKFMSNKVTIEIDFGQFRPILTDNRLKDPATGKSVVFNSMIDALNYMGNRGWDFVQAYAVSSGNARVYYYLLKKPTRDWSNEGWGELAKEKE